MPTAAAQGHFDQFVGPFPVQLMNSAEEPEPDSVTPAQRLTFQLFCFHLTVVRPEDVHDQKHRDLREVWTSLIRTSLTEESPDQPEEDVFYLLVRMNSSGLLTGALN